ncbi:putative protein-lysine deacylase ABHD14B isoform X1 [Tigriopus californicus]|uniref:putative protein-lysine deacylase ABHD14B isoform X1 n=1 Tax=Tigriopus californicus TaxID=6832 RepID=UPI0027DA8AED|nr:putative protein-lysine deacylase ABHD14B isoform X1 [Tigriopus californicus]
MKRFYQKVLQLVSNVSLVLYFGALTILAWTWMTTSNSSMMTKRDWGTFDYLFNDIPENVSAFLDTSAHDIEVLDKAVYVQGQLIFAIEAAPKQSVLPKSGKGVLLLHGWRSFSETWYSRLKTLQLLALLGHRAVAVDLPGLGKSSKTGFPRDLPKFLNHLLVVLFNGTKAVVVSPSYSGTFSIPLLTQEPDLFCGFVPMSPIIDIDLDGKSVKSIQVPTLIIVSDLDSPTEKESIAVLKAIPTSTEALVLEATEGSFPKDPNVFHTALYNFIEVLNCD